MDRHRKSLSYGDTAQCDLIKPSGCLRESSPCLLQLDTNNLLSACSGDLCDRYIDYGVLAQRVNLMSIDAYSL